MSFMTQPYIYFNNTVNLPSVSIFAFWKKPNTNIRDTIIIDEDLGEVGIEQEEVEVGNNNDKDIFMGDSQINFQLSIKIAPGLH